MPDELKVERWSKESGGRRTIYRKEGDAAVRACACLLGLAMGGWVSEGCRGCGCVLGKRGGRGMCVLGWEKGGRGTYACVLEMGVSGAVGRGE